MTRSFRLALVGLFLIGCSPGTAWFSKNVPADQDQFARSYLALVRSGQADSAHQLLDASVQDSFSIDLLRRMGSELEPAKVDSATLVGAMIRNTGAERHAHLSYELPLADSLWMLAGVYVKDGRVLQLALQSSREPLRESNSLRLAGKSWVHYLVAALAVLVPLLCLAAAFGALTTGIERRWLWALVALVGIFRISINWTSGALAYAPLGFQLLGTGVTKSGPYAPWLVSFSFPIGAAVVFARLLTRQKVSV